MSVFELSESLEPEYVHADMNLLDFATSRFFGTGGCRLVPNPEVEMHSNFVAFEAEDIDTDEPVYCEDWGDGIDKLESEIEEDGGLVWNFACIAEAAVCVVASDETEACDFVSKQLSSYFCIEEAASSELFDIAEIRALSAEKRE